MKYYLKSFKKWMEKAKANDPALRNEFKELMEYIMEE